MRNRNILLTGTMLLLAAATAAGAPQGGGQGSEPVLTAERIAADSAIRARRTLRVYQTLELPYARTLNKTAARATRRPITNTTSTNTRPTISATRSRASSQDSPSAS